MKAVICKELGPPEKLVVEDVAEPRMGASDVRIRVAAAGINFPDTLQIAGRYQMKLELPFTPGAEVAGTVLEVGAKVSHLKAGDAVAAMIPCGGYAEQAVAPAMVTLPLPAGMDLVVAGGFPLVYGTSLHALKQRAQLKAGETLLVLGAAGGVGLTAIQIGKLMGARVIAAASTDDKLAICREHGADDTINYRDSSLKEAVKALTKGRGADVIYDPVGDRYAADCLSSLAWNGRWLIVGFAGGEIPQIAVNRLLLKGAAAVGVFWGSFVAREPQVNLENFRQLFAWHTAGQLKSIVSHRYALADAAQALRDMLDRKITGKIVLTP